MDLNQIPLFAMLKSKLSYTSQRQQLIAGNVANADVPNYAPRDLKPFSFNQALQSAGGAGSVSLQVVPAVRTSAMHIDAGSAPPLAAPGAGPTDAPDSELRLDGNHVVLEEQMVKLSEARMDYDAAIGFYQQSLGMLRTAIKKPGE